MLFRVALAARSSALAAGTARRAAGASAMLLLQQQLRSYADDSTINLQTPAQVRIVEPAEGRTATQLRRQIEQSRKLKEENEKLAKKLKERQEARLAKLRQLKEDAERKLKERVGKIRDQRRVKELKAAIEVKHKRKADEAKARETRQMKKLSIKQKEYERQQRAKERELAKRAGKPKRAMTAFFWFLQQNFKQFKRTIEEADARAHAMAGNTTEPVPKVSAPRVLAFAREMFDKIDESTRKRFDDLAAQDRERYTREMNNFRQRKAAVPKRPLTPYFRFLAEQRETLNRELQASGLQGRELILALSKEAGKRWQQLPASEKKQYTQAFEKDQAAFRQQQGNQ